MPKRKDSELVQDIMDAIGKIQRYIAGKSYQEFLRDSMVQDAVVRNLEIIGEAVKGLSTDFKKRHKAVKWPDIAGMRDRLIHHYAGVNLSIVWDVTQAKLPDLKVQLLSRPRNG
jgi:hypothetical protein